MTAPAQVLAAVRSIPHPRQEPDMTAPLPSPAEQAVIDRFDAAPVPPEVTVEKLTTAARDLVHHIARMHDRWADMGAEDPDARNRELWAPLHRKADAVRDLIPGEAL